MPKCVNDKGGVNDKGVSTTSTHFPHTLALLWDLGLEVPISARHKNVLPAGHLTHHLQGLSRCGQANLLMKPPFTKKKKKKREKNREIQPFCKAKCEDSGKGHDGSSLLPFATIVRKNELKTIPTFQSQNKLTLPVKPHPRWKGQEPVRH